jgi:hypothetical protein
LIAPPSPASPLPTITAEAGIESSGDRRKRILDRLEKILDQQVTHLETASAKGPLLTEDHEALANIARVAKKIMGVGETEDRLPALSAHDIAQAIELLKHGD